MQKLDKVGIFSNALRYSEPYSEWRSEVIDEQGKRCQICGTKNKIHVHHVKYFRSIVKEFLSRYDHLDAQKDKEELLACAETWDDLWDTDNGIVLCNNCHSFEHPNLILEED